MKKETLSNKIEDISENGAYPEDDNVIHVKDAKEKIQNVQRRLKENLDFDNLDRAFIDFIFKEEIGESLLE